MRLRAVLLIGPILGAASAPADDPMHYVQIIRTPAADYPYCSQSQAVTNTNTHQRVKVTITDHYNRNGQPGVWSVGYVLGPSETQQIGCGIAINPGLGTTINQYSIASAVFI